MMKGNFTPSCDRITSAMMPGNVTYDNSVVITTLLHEFSVLMGHTTPLIGLHLYLNYTQVLHTDACLLYSSPCQHTLLIRPPPTDTFPQYTVFWGFLGFFATFPAGKNWFA